VGRTVAALLLVAMAGGARADAPLTAADVVRFLKAGISEHTILVELQSRGFAEPLDAQREAALREAGASETLIVAIRRVAPEAPTPKAPPPPTVYDSPVVVTPEDGHEATFAASTRTVRVPVAVLDKSGEPVVGLGEADFRIAENGKWQDVTLFSTERRPMRLALALDTSKSMENKARQVEAALKHFIDLLEPADQVLVMTFSDDLHIAQDFTSDRDLLGRVLDSIEPQGGTALYEAAYEAIRRLAEGPEESKAVVLVTDGVDTVSAMGFRDLRDYARRAGVPVFSIGLDSGMLLDDMVIRRPSFPGRGGWPGGGGHGGWPGGHGGWPGGHGGWPGGGGGGGGGGPGGTGRPGRLAFDDKPLEQLAEDTGARAEVVKGLEHYTPASVTPGDDQLKRAVESIALTLRHRYLLGYEPPEGKRGWREIRVEVDKPALTALARKGYYSGT
jgi:VWFA-related protein